MHIIASSRPSQGRQSSEHQGLSPQRIDKQGRPMMSTRRSAASSSRTVTQLNNGPTITAPSAYPASPPAPRRTSYGAAHDQTSPKQGLSEAGAYARAMTSTLTRSESTQENTILRPATAYNGEMQHTKSDRPLPRPPSQPIETPVRTPIDLASRAIRAPPDPFTEVSSRPSARRSDETSSPSAVKASIKPPPRIPKSPSREQPSSPLRQAERSDSIGPFALSGGSITQNQSLQHPAKQSSGTLLAPAVSRRRASILQRPAGRLQLDFLLAQPAIQSSLLGAIGINTFLSLSGSSEDVRRHFTGESVGRWVLGEWNVVPSDQAGNRWPNLTVWEGFRK